MCVCVSPKVVMQYLKLCSCLGDPSGESSMSEKWAEPQPNKAKKIFQEFPDIPTVRFGEFLLVASEASLYVHFNQDSFVINVQEY